MNQERKVCVIMPVYNGEDTIELALKSLLAQTYSNWECVIVNDGSTDGTKSILDSLSDKRFNVIHLEKNVGRGAARQVCLDNAEGNYLAYLDADDFYHSQKLSKQVEFLENNKEISLVSCGVASYYNDFELISKKCPSKIQYFNSYNKGELFTAASAMIYLDEAKRIKYEQISVSEDMRYFSKYLEGKKYCKLPDILYYYNEAGTNYKKIMSFQWEKVKNAANDLKKTRGLKLTGLLKALSKLMAKSVIVPIIGQKRFIANRGKKVLDTDILEFKQEIANVMRNKLL